MRKNPIGSATRAGTPKREVREVKIMVKVNVKVKVKVKVKV